MNSSQKPFKVSLVIPAHNEEKYIGHCLDYAIKNSKDQFHEIIVIDNASTDATKEIAEAKGVKVFTEMQKGLTRARQAGLLCAEGDLVAYIDADTRLPEGWVEKATQMFSKNEKMVCLSGPYRYHDGPRWMRTVMNVLWYVSAPLTYYMVGYMVLGGNFIAKKSALQDMGGFDKNIEFYGEDTDIARRLSKFGRVKFRMDFYIYSSIRRVKEEGLLKTNIVYALNYFWQVFFHKSFTRSYRDIRQT